MLVQYGCLWEKLKINTEWRGRSWRAAWRLPGRVVHVTGWGRTERERSGGASQRLAQATPAPVPPAWSSALLSSKMGLWMWYSKEGGQGRRRGRARRSPGSTAEQRPLHPPRCRAALASQAACRSGAPRAEADGGWRRLEGSGYVLLLNRIWTQTTQAGAQLQRRAV